MANRAYLVGLIHWPVAPVVPFVVGLALRIGERTAAAGGILTFLLASTMVFLVF